MRHADFNNIKLKKACLGQNFRVEKKASGLDFNFFKNILTKKLKRAVDILNI